LAIIDSSRSFSFLQGEGTLLHETIMADPAKTTSDSGSDGGYGFGTFKGVFVPSILTILGVIMYLRFGWVLGQVGLGKTLLIVTLATSVTFFTALSMSALATNRRVGGGGAYFIISRSLGVEAGAAVGLPLFIAQALGVSFYVAGFSEALAGVFPGVDPRVAGVVTLCALTGLAYISADLALRAQFVILALVLASLASFFAGAPVESAPAVSVAPVARVPFWAVFAVFFPAVTGIEAGIAMSGDLKSPSRSLPLGTLAAVGVGFMVYLLIPIFLIRQVPDPDRLVRDTMIMRDVARWGGLVVVGVWCAALSSGMGALLGAPRTLQALARDRVLPRVIGRGFGKNNDPRIATLISFTIALGGILAGDLNLIAPVLTMFFLTSYGCLNVSAGLEATISPPSWRPAFRIPGWVSLTGALFCFAVMFMINAGATILALLVSAAVYAMMRRRSIRGQWGDMKYGIYMLAARAALRRLEGMKPDERTWMPNILVFSGAPTRRWHLIELAHSISRNQNFLTVATFLPESGWSAEREESASESIRSYLHRRGVEAHVKIFRGDAPLPGALELIRGYGFGSIEPNTVLIGESQDEDSFPAFARLTMDLYRSRRNLVIVREQTHEEADIPSLLTGTRIDIWWRGNHANIGLMLTLAYTMKRSSGWTSAELVIRRIVDADESREDAERALREYIQMQRIEATVDVMVKDRPNVLEMVRDTSSETDLALLGIRPPDEGEDLESYTSSYRRLLIHTEGLPPSALVLAAQDIEFFRLVDAPP
jgi:amino acid transporter